MSELDLHPRRRWIRHLFCRDVTWRYPAMAEFWSMHRETFLLTCKECGHQRRIVALEIQEAIFADAVRAAKGE